MNVGNEELLVLSETNTDSHNILSTLVRPLEDSGYSVHIADPDNCVSAIEKYHPNIILLPFSIIHESLDFADLLSCIHAKDNELSVILLAAESLTPSSDGFDSNDLAKSNPLNTKKLPPQERDSKTDKVVHFKSAQVQALLEQGAEDVVFSSEEDALTIVIVKRAIEHAMEKKQQRQLIDENNALRLALRTLELDMTVAAHTVTKMSPESPAQLGSFQMEYLTKPCLAVGGDSVNYFQLKDGRVVFYFADVSGHGAAAAIVTAALMTLEKPFLRACDHGLLANTPEMLSWYNEELLSHGYEQHVTMFLGLLDDSKSTFQYSNAAHFPSVILQSNGCAEYLELQGLPLAMCKTKYEFRELKVSDSFNLVMFSDGVLEIMGQSTLSEKEETLLSLVKYGDVSVESLQEKLGIGKLESTPDDIAIFTIVRKN
ncbi:MAG: sigma-B regulation protein RsbU (phosphoserine phosphatase) [Candidatus Azotimanducaceae bacterium]|jgi:sigma-B regulation protein RsbU (phosphoserine phosphatase)